MEAESKMARRLWHVVRAVLFMLRKGMSKQRKLAMDLNLLLHRGKIAGKAIGKLMTAHGHHHHHHHDNAAAADHATPHPQQQQSFSSRALDPALAVCNPREVEFSCSNTPASYPSLNLRIPTGGKQQRRRRGSRRTHLGANGAEPGWYNYDAADIAKVFEILNNNEEQLLSGRAGGAGGEQQPSPLAVVATPSPVSALWASFGRTPEHARQLRITDSPFPLRDDDAAAADGAQVDREADEFIKKFYEQLRTQQNLASATPEYGYGGYARPVNSIA